MLKAGIRWLYFFLALLSLALGIIGAFLPILPTVPFILLAAWFAAKSSPRLLNWLEGHPKYGPPIHDWRVGGVVSRKAKWAATTMMSLSAVIILLKHSANLQRLRLGIEPRLGERREREVES